jgi:hypothetical protein
VPGTAVLYVGNLWECRRRPDLWDFCGAADTHRSRALDDATSDSTMGRAGESRRAKRRSGPATARTRSRCPAQARASSRHETGEYPDYGLCAAVDVHYLSTGAARAATFLAADTAFAHVLAERTAVVPRVPPHRPGEFYLRELPPLRAVLDDLTGLGLLVVARYADLDPSGRPGLAANAHAEFASL